MEVKQHIKFLEDMQDQSTAAGKKIMKVLEEGETVTHVLANQVTLTHVLANQVTILAAMNALMGGVRHILEGPGWKEKEKGPVIPMDQL